jgi:hypothetical protein
MTSCICNLEKDKKRNVKFKLILKLNVHRANSS